MGSAQLSSVMNTVSRYAYTIPHSVVLTIYDLIPVMLLSILLCKMKSNTSLQLCILLLAYGMMVLLNRLIQEMLLVSDLLLSLGRKKPRQQGARRPLIVLLGMVMVEDLVCLECSCLYVSSILLYILFLVLKLLRFIHFYFLL